MAKIPLEGLVKYLDKKVKTLEGKLDMLVPYTKSLESQLRQKEEECERLREGIKALKVDYKQSDWYITMVGEYRRQIKSLQKKLGEKNKLLNDLFCRIGKEETKQD